PQRVTVSSERDGDTKLRQTDYTFNGGLLETVVSQPQDSDLRLTTVVGRDAFNNVSSITWSDSQGNTRQQSFEYDSRGIYPLVRYNSQLHPTQFRFDERHGQVTLAVDPNGIETKYAYDGFGRLREVVAPEGSMTFDFEAAFSGAHITLPVRATHKVVSTVNGFPEAETEYDAFGRVVRTVSAGYE